MQVTYSFPDLWLLALCRSVRKAAVQMLSSAAHSKASLVSAQLPAVLPQLFKQTVIDASLIRTVDLGPFKHKIDDGLELRKATFECMDVLLDTCADRLDYTAFLEHLESGLKVQNALSHVGGHTCALCALLSWCKGVMQMDVGCTFNIKQIWWM